MSVNALAKEKTTGLSQASMLSLGNAHSRPSQLCLQVPEPVHIFAKHREA